MSTRALFPDFLISPTESWTMTQLSSLFVHDSLCVNVADFHKTRGNNTSPFYTATFTKLQWENQHSSFVHKSSVQTETSLIGSLPNDASHWQIFTFQIKVSNTLFIVALWIPGSSWLNIFSNSIVSKWVFCCLMTIFALL